MDCRRRDRRFPHCDTDLVEASYDIASRKEAGTNETAFWYA